MRTRTASDAEGEKRDGRKGRLGLPEWGDNPHGSIKRELMSGGSATSTVGFTGLGTLAPVRDNRGLPVCTRVGAQVGFL